MPFSLPFCSQKFSKTPKLIAVIHASIFLLLASTTVSLDATSHFLKRIDRCHGLPKQLLFLILERSCSSSSKRILLLSLVARHLSFDYEAKVKEMSNDKGGWQGDEAGSFSWESSVSTLPFLVL